ncbi:hypothetical protein HT585_03900 [Ensifer sp. HO-A22]|uniref:Uncharacterized protein n=1 Tax=Ensifer oleiphilus TaxID=2742698 RepID=A0A7Y6Q2R5_9HYPH|nr:hypothetical protein [Ensifer oleiphilus]NVD37986.1 hypothetical protein [Ensifer oleiphilus]
MNDYAGLREIAGLAHGIATQKKQNGRRMAAPVEKYTLDVRAKHVAQKYAAVLR